MTKSTVCTTIVLVFLCASALAQPDGPRPPRGDGPPDGPRRPHPLLVALDTDRDGTLSTEEINGAVEALKKLDEDNDGKLTREEMRPPRDGEGRGGPGGRGNGGRGGRGGGFGTPEEFANDMMERDENKDGKLTADELPDWGQGMLERRDTNSDGGLDKEELRVAAENFQRQFGGGGGGRGGGGRGGDDNRPQRPDRPARPPMEE